MAFFAQILGDSRRTFFCEPHRVEELRAVIEQAGLAGLITVIGSPFCPEGAVLVVDSAAIEASNRETQQHGLRNWDFGFVHGPEPEEGEQ
jgi:hypothetical protein